MLCSTHVVCPVPEVGILYIQERPIKNSPFIERKNVIFLSNGVVDKRRRRETYHS